LIPFATGCKIRILPPDFLQVGSRGQQKMTAIKGTEFLVIGRAGMDLYADPPGSEIETAGAFTTALGGSAANIAAGLCRQGARAALLTAVSDDAVGRFVRAQLRGYGVDDSLVTVVAGEARTSLAVVETRIENTQSVIYRNNAADFQMSVADVERVDFARFHGVVVTGTVFAAEPSRGAGFRALELARAAGVPVILDIDYRPYSWASAQEAEGTYARAAEMTDILVGNDVEFGFLAGGYDAGLEAARRFAGQAGRISVYKMGEAGAVTFHADEEIRTGIFATEALKPTGAGDAFMAGFLVALAARKAASGRRSARIGGGGDGRGPGRLRPRDALRGRD
jgi:5-dehydro-2-deoxygluconokinase